MEEKPLILIHFFIIIILILSLKKILFCKFFSPSTLIGFFFFFSLSKKKLHQENSPRVPCNNFLLNVTNSPITVVTNYNKLLLNSSTEFCYWNFNKKIIEAWYFLFKWVPAFFFLFFNFSSYSLTSFQLTEINM